MELTAKVVVSRTPQSRAPLLLGDIHVGGLRPVSREAALTRRYRHLRSARGRSRKPWETGRFQLAQVIA